MSCCPTFELNALEATGNLASGQTDLVNNAVLKAFVARQPHQSVALCCPTVPFISPYAGGIRAEGSRSACSVSSSSVTPRRTSPSPSYNRPIQRRSDSRPRAWVHDSRPWVHDSPSLAPCSPFRAFQQYNRPPAFMPCPRVTNNAGMPAAVDGPCTNVINFIQTWPPS